MGLEIKSTDESVKIVETHYEQFVRLTKETIGENPVSLINDVYAHEGSSTHPMNDIVYQEVARVLLNRQMDEVRDQGYPLSDLSIEDIYQNKHGILADFRSNLNTLHHVHRFSKQRMIFRFEEALTAKLMQTDLKKIDSQFIASPFKSLYIDMPATSKLTIPDPENPEGRRVKGIYLSYEHDVDMSGVQMGQGEKVGKDEIHEDLIYNGKPATKILRVLAIGDDTKGDKNLVYNTPTFYMTLVFAPGDVFEQVKLMLAKFAGDEGAQSTHCDNLVSFVVNALLYITNPNADFRRIHAKYAKAKKRGKKKSKVASTAQGSKIDIISTGSSVKISPEFRSQYRSGALTSNTINVPVWMVRGHWRNQAYGKGKKLRRLQWIEPFTKGKGLDASLETSGRDYEVE